MYSQLRINRTALVVAVSLLGGCSNLERTVKGVISSTIQTMMDANMETTLLGAYAMAQVHGLQFKLMKIPDSVEIGADPFVFDPDIMKVLFEKGRAHGRSPSSWVVAPSAGQYASPWLIQVLSELRRQR